MSVNLEENIREVKIINAEKKQYVLFSEQFLEKPGKYEIGTGPSICTIKKIPCFDDW